MIHLNRRPHQAFVPLTPSTANSYCVRNTANWAVELKPSRSRPDRGIAALRSEPRNRLGEIVQVVIAKLIVPLRNLPSEG